MGSSLAANTIHSEERETIKCKITTRESSCVTKKTGKCVKKNIVAGYQRGQITHLAGHPYIVILTVCIVKKMYKGKVGLSVLLFSIVYTACFFALLS